MLTLFYQLIIAELAALDIFLLTVMTMHGLENRKTANIEEKNSSSRILIAIAPLSFALIGW